MSKIIKLIAREIIDSRAQPTLEVELTLEGGFTGRGSVPSGASTGIHEALELRDMEKKRYFGKGVLKSINNVISLFDKLKGKEFFTQKDIDNFLIELDGSSNKQHLGANTILGISIAFARAMAALQNRELFRYIGDILNIKNYKIPVPMFNVLNGGKHANWATDLQEFMIIPQLGNYSHNLRSACEIFNTIENLLKQNGANTNVGNEGGFAPGFTKTQDALAFLQNAVETSGYTLQNIKFGLDIAASEFFDFDSQNYILKTGGATFTKAEWLTEIFNWINNFPIISVEDPFEQDGWESWQEFTKSIISKGINIVGDDLLVTNTSRIKEAISKNACNTALIKPNQIGTVTETLDAINLAKNAAWKTVVSHRSGDTEDVFIAHLAVGANADFIKSGAPNRGERTSKYNELLRISEQL